MNAGEYFGGGPLFKHLLFSHPYRFDSDMVMSEPLGHTRSGHLSLDNLFVLLSTAKLMVPGSTFRPILYCRCIANDARIVFRF